MRQQPSRLLSTLVLGLLLSGGCTAALPSESDALLAGGDEYVVMVLHLAGRGPAGPARFHDCSVDRRAVLSDAAARRDLATTLESDLSRDGPATGCMFAPHYGVHVAKGQRTLDMEICFSCDQCLVFRDRGPWQTGNSASGPKAAFKSVLQHAGVPAAKEYDD